MRDVISNYTIEQINAVIDEILVNLNANVRNLSGTGADSERPVLFSYTNYNGQTFYVRGSKFLYNIVVDSADGYELKQDVTSVIGDKSGIKLAPALVDYRKEHAQHYWTGVCGIRNNDGTTNGYEFYMDAMHDGDTQYASIDIMSYKVIGVEAGSTHTVTFRGRFSTTSHGGGDVYACISDSATDTTGMGRVVLTKDNDWHDYTFTFTNTSSEDTLYLNFVFNVNYTIGTGRYLVEGLLFSGMDIDILSTHVYYNGEWYKVSGSGGGSSDVELIEISKADYDLLPQSAKDDPNKVYFVYNYPSGGSAGGGSTVEITPTLSSGTKIADYEIDGVSGALYAPTPATPPDDLNDLSDVAISSPTNGQVLKYNSTSGKWENSTGGGGGGGNFEITDLWKNTTGGGNGTYTLSQSIDDFDAISIWFGIYNEYVGNPYISDHRIINVSELQEAHNAGIKFILTGYASRVIYVDFDGTTMILSSQSGSQTVLQVKGINF